MSNPLKRETTRWEGWLPWSIMGLLLTLGGGFWVWQTDTEQLASPYSHAGISMGILAVVLGGLSMAYSLRKRGQSTRGSMMAWLMSHVVLGGTALLLALVHVGNRLGAPSFSLAVRSIAHCVQLRSLSQLATLLEMKAMFARANCDGQSKARAS